MSEICVCLCLFVVILGSEDQEEAEGRGSLSWQIQAAGGTVLPSVHPGESGECVRLLFSSKSQRTIDRVHYDAKVRLDNSGRRFYDASLREDLKVIFEHSSK